MKARFDAGTDVAMIGAWDAQRGAQPVTPEEYKRLADTLDADADAGHIFVLHTRADGGGPVDVYVDEPVPSEVMTRLTVQEGEFVLALPSGSLMVDGVEHYRARKPDAAAADRAVPVPAGDYALRCFAAQDDEEAAPRSERDLESILGKDDLRYYDRITRGGCLTGALPLLLLPVLWPFFGVKVALAAAIVVVVAYFNVREWVLRRNARFARIRATVTALRVQRQEPTFVLALRRIQDDTSIGTPLPVIGGST
jgi:hypothetical protein